MDFSDTPTEAAFRADVRAFLAANAALKSSGAPRPDSLEASRAWQATKARAGFAGLTWPKEWGGQGRSAIEQVIYAQEEAQYVTPPDVFAIGLGMCVPTLCVYGGQAQRDRFAPPALRGEEIWCQLFSEPAAGSDVAGLRTRAVRDGDDWVINGQKVWTSGAQFADYGIIVTRSDPNVPKHKGLTFFFLDMRSPGIEVRPIRQMSGGSSFNEVYFTDVRVPDAQRLGAVGDGWRVSLTTLMNERLAVGDAPAPDFKEIFEFARTIDGADGPAIRDGAVRERLADWYVQAQGLKYTKFRTMTALSRGQTAGPEASIAKLVSASKLQDIASFGVDLMGAAGAADHPMGRQFQDAFLTSPGLRIAGGTDEILRNIIAERVLGLPADVRVDKEAAFRDLPVGR